MNQPARPQQRAMGAPIHIETNGFLLRSLTAADATPRFLNWLNSTEMLSGLNLPALNFTHDQLVHFINSFNNLNNYLVGIFAPKSQQLIGFYTMDVNLTHKTGNITTGIGEPLYEGKGVLWATIDALLDHFFVYKQVDKIIARVLASNKRMLFNFVGNPRFAYEAKLYKECVGINGQRVDVLLFAAFQSEADLKNAGEFLL